MLFIKDPLFSNIFGFKSIVMNRLKLGEVRKFLESKSEHRQWPSEILLSNLSGLFEEVILLQSFWFQLMKIFIGLYWKSHWGQRPFPISARSLYLETFFESKAVRPWQRSRSSAAHAYSGRLQANCRPWPDSTNNSLLNPQQDG